LVIATRETSRRLHQAFLGQRFLDLGARTDAGLVGCEFGKPGDRTSAARPVQHREQIGVGDGELLAHHVILPVSAPSRPELAHPRSLKKALASSASMGENIGPKFLCSSVVMKLSYSMSLALSCRGQARVLFTALSAII
jgi:hypothetical protein